MKQSIKAAVLLSALVILAACSSVPTKEYTALERYQAALYALQENYTLATIVAACNQLDEASKTYAAEVQQEWWDTNWYWVAGANEEFNQQIKQRQESMGEYLGQLEALNFIKHMELNTNSDIKNKILLTNHRSQACERRLRPYVQGEKKLSDSQYGKILEAIRLNYLNASVSPRRPVPDFQTDVEVRYKEGRSLVEVERTARDEVCAEAQVVLLKEQWPLEIYGVMCGDVARRVVKCEWGACNKVEGM